MALNIKNHAVEELVSLIISITGENKTEAIRKSLEERHERLRFQIAPRDKRQELINFMEREIWSSIPEDRLGKKWTKKKEETLLGYGSMGV